MFGKLHDNWTVARAWMGAATRPIAARFRCFNDDQRGQTFVDYLLVLAIIAFVAWAAYSQAKEALPNQIQTMFANLGKFIGSLAEMAGL